MTKVNLLKALTQAEQDSVPPFEVRCNRGQRFARYRKHGIETPNDYWAWKYFQAGGLVDACGVWGFTPQQLTELEKQEIDPEKLGAIVKIRGRVDYDGNEIIQMAKWELVPRTIQEFHRNVRGILRKMQLEKMEVPVARGVIALGWMSEVQFEAFVCKRLNKISKDAAMFLMDVVILCERVPQELSPAAKKALVCAEKYERRLSHAIDGEALRPTDILHSRKAMRYVIQNVNKIVRADYVKMPMFLYKGKLNSIRTTLGYFCCGQHGGHDFSREGVVFHRSKWNDLGMKEYHARRVGAYWVLKLDGVTFAWHESFVEHIEGTTVKDALEKLEKRVKKKSLILSLNDVRNDVTGTSGYCLAGVKGFAQDRMRFLYRLIAPYSSWKDVPADIMATEFHLASKEIFAGYSNLVG